MGMPFKNTGRRILKFDYLICNVVRPTDLI